MMRVSGLRPQGTPCPVSKPARYGWLRPIVNAAVAKPAVRPVTWTDRIDSVLTHRMWGTLVFLLVMFAVFESIFVLATPVMDQIKDGFDAAAKGVEASMAAGPFRSLITDGVIKGVGGVLVFLPQILILFGFIAILEDCGYMARAAFLMDRLMSKCGLSGKSFIPMLSSVACAVPGIMATRVIENRRDRLATILVAPLMSCSARLPVYALLIGAFLTEGYAWWVPGLALRHVHDRLHDRTAGGTPAQTHAAERRDAALRDGTAGVQATNVEKHSPSHVGRRFRICRSRARSFWRR